MMLKLIVSSFYFKMSVFYGTLVIVPFVQAEATSFDAPISILIGALGTAIAGTIVVVVQKFLDHLKEQNKVIMELKDSFLRVQSESHKHADNMADRFIKRQEDTQRSFQEHIQKLTEGQNQVLGETVMAVKSLENSLRSVQDNVQLLLVTMRPSDKAIEITAPNKAAIEKQ
jgi:hypothetical protein